MNNRLFYTIISVVILLILVRFGLAVFATVFRYWFITLPVLLILYFSKKKRKMINKPLEKLDPSKEVKIDKKSVKVEKTEE